MGKSTRDFTVPRNIVLFPKMEGTRYMMQIHGHLMGMFEMFHTRYNSTYSCLISTSFTVIHEILGISGEFKIGHN